MQAEKKQVNLSCYIKVTVSKGKRMRRKNKMFEQENKVEVGSQLLKSIKF
jgi:hypothetical protein